MKPNKEQIQILRKLKKTIRIDWRNMQPEWQGKSRFSGGHLNRILQGSVYAAEKKMYQNFIKTIDAYIKNKHVDLQDD